MISASRIAPALAGVILTVASGSLNVTYAIARAPDSQALQATYAGMAIAAAIGTASCLPALVRALNRLDIPRAAVALVGLILFGSYSLSCALGSAGSTQTSAARTEHDATAARSRAQTAHDAAQRELATIGITRAPAEIQAEIDAALGTRRDLDVGQGACRGWLPSAAARGVCINVADLRAEIETAQRRARLIADAETARYALDSTSSIRPANSDAASIARLLTALGRPADTDTVALWLLILTAVLVELGGGICFALSGPQTRRLPASGIDASFKRQTVEAGSSSTCPPTAVCTQISTPRIALATTSILNAESIT